MTETLCPALQRREPQLGSIMLAHAIEIAIIAFSRPVVEHGLDNSASPGDFAADQIIDRAMATPDGDLL